MPGLIPPEGRAPPLPHVTPVATARLPEGPLAIVAATQPSPFGAFATVCAGGPAICFDGPRLNVVGTHDEHDGGTCAAAFSVDGAHFITGGQDGAWVIRGDGRARRSDADTAWVEHVTFSRDGRRFAFCRGRRVTIVDTASGEVCVTHTLPSTPTALRFYDGVLTAACYGGVHVWSNNGTGSLRQYPWRSALLSLVQSPDARFYAAGCQDAAVHCWRRSTGEDFEMSGYPAKVKALAFSHDSRFLATGGSDTITVWDFAGTGPQGSTPRELVGHAQLVTSLAFSSPRRLWSGGADGAVIGWDLDGRRGAAAIALHVHDAPIVDLIIVDRHVIAAHSDGVMVSLEVAQ
jgi:WD40 repeat protein